jgi:hypothetical protein
VDILFKSFVFYCALAIGFIVILLGIKSFNIKYSKTHKVFLISLFVLFSLHSCRADEDMDSITARIHQLNETGSWRNFKTFWKRLDKIEPYTSYIQDGETIESQSYQLFLNPNREKVDELNLRLDQHLNKLKELELLSDYEMELLGRICSLRISFLFENNLMYLTRLAPPPIYNHKVESQDQLELKIDGLAELYNDELIDEVELNTALESIIQELHNTLVMSAILLDSDYHYDYYSMELSSDNSVEAHIAWFNEYLESQFPNGNIDSKNREILNDIDKINNAIDTLRPLIEDLVTPD